MNRRVTAAVLTGVLAVSGFGLITAGAGSAGSPPDAIKAEGTDLSDAPFSSRGAGGPIRFVVDPAFSQGEKAPIRIENVGSRTYLYEVSYPACYNVSFFDSSGRELTIPPGTHCDLISSAPIKPGQTRRLFTWKLDECVKDRWGCVKSEPLPPGTYRLEGKFRLRRGGASARPTAEIQILEG